MPFREQFAREHKVCDRDQSWADSMNAGINPHRNDRPPNPEVRYVPCPLAGQRHPICDGHRRMKGPRAGTPCAKYPPHGGYVCSRHGGNTAQARQAAARRVAEAKAMDELAMFAAKRDIDPATAMSEILQSKAGQVIYLRTLVNTLPKEALKQTDTSGKFERESVWVGMLWQAERDLAAVCKMMMDVGFAERTARYVDAQAMLLMAGLGWMRRELGFELDPRWEAAERAMLAALAAGAPPDGRVIEGVSVGGQP